MIILYALIGLVVGGIVNLLADVLPQRHKKVTAPVCPACDQPRAASQSLAVLAFLIGKRKCPSCGRPIAWRNPVVELALAALFALLYNFYSDQLVKLVLASFFTSVLLLVTVTDFEHRLIPNRAILPAIALAALAAPLWFWHEYWYVAFIGGAIGYGFFWLAVVVGDKFLGRGAMGWGDVRLAAFVGLITGFPGIITALVVTIIAGGVISLFLLLTRLVNLRSGIPYGPFICLGGFITMLYGQQIMNRFFFGS
ncbi:Type 4 prepilin-like proteins leader peptide-processing enzyme [Thermoflexales bacterium]|nr:Type 4 prepilin-like proteins leader peptide-processing enzyme [Thermoflexales bacterium]